MSDKEITLFDYIGILLKNRKIVAWITILAALVGLLLRLSDGKTYIAEIRIWASDPLVSLEFLKTNQLTNSSEVFFQRFERLEGNAISVQAVSSKSAFAEEAVKNIFADLSKKHSELASSRSAEERKNLEEQIRFVLEKQRQGLNFENFPFSITAQAVPFIYPLNENPRILQSNQLIDLIKCTFFGLLLGFFFSVLLVLLIEYFRRHDSDWNELRRKYLS